MEAILSIDGKEVVKVDFFFTENFEEDKKGLHPRKKDRVPFKTLTGELDRTEAVKQGDVTDAGTWIKTKNYLYVDSDTVLAIYNQTH